MIIPRPRVGHPPIPAHSPMPNPDILNPSRSGGNLRRMVAATARHLRVSVLAVIVCLLAGRALVAQSGTIAINTGAPGTVIPSTLFGAFFEEINLAGEGGLYAELVRNRSFNNSANPDFWSLITPATAGWDATTGAWGVDTGVSPAAYRQSGPGTDCRSVYTAAGSTAWSNYTLTLHARTLSGSEGFLVMFNVADQANWYRWNIGGWDNTKHAVQYSINGAQTSGPQVAGTITTGQWYDVKIVVQGTSVG